MAQNHPERFDLVVLPDGLAKVKAIPETKIANAMTFFVEREDHTLGNLVRMEMLRDNDVSFAGYRMPHPLEPRFELKIQTTRESNPMAAVITAVDNLKAEASLLQERFEDALRQFRNPTDRWQAKVV